MTALAAPPAGAGDSPIVDIEEVRHAVSVAIAREMERYEKENGRPMPLLEQRAEVDRLTKGLLRQARDEAMQSGRGGDTALSKEDVEAVCERVRHYVFAAGELQPLLDDPDVQEIRCFGFDNVWLKFTNGETSRGPRVDSSDAGMIERIQRLVAESDMGERRYDTASPIVDFTLDAHRGFAVRDFSLRPQLILRRHDFTRLATLDQQVAAGMLSPGLAKLLRAAVRARKNIVVSGGPDTGKTTHVRALGNEIPSHEHVLTIEDTLELGLHRFPDLHPQLSVWWTRNENLEGKGRLDQFELGRAGLRASPDRVILGEARGREALQLVLAMSQGCDGSMSSVHASSSLGALDRLVTLLTMDGASVTWASRAVAQAVQLVVHLAKLRRTGRAPLRAVVSVREVTGCEGAQIASSEIFGPGPDGRATPRPGAMSESLLDDLAAEGFDVYSLDRAGEW